MKYFLGILFGYLVGGLNPSYVLGPDQRGGHPFDRLPQRRRFQHHDCNRERLGRCCYVWIF